MPILPILHTNAILFDYFIASSFTLWLYFAVPSNVTLFLAHVRHRLLTLMNRLTFDILSFWI